MALSPSSSRGGFTGGTVPGAVVIQPTDLATIPLVLNVDGTVTADLLNIDGDSGDLFVGHAGDLTTNARATMGADLVTLGYVAAYAHNILAVSQNFAPFDIPLRINEDSYLILKQNAAPADAALSANEVAVWFDSTNGAAKFMFKAKQADGTVKTGSVNVQT